MSHVLTCCSLAQSISFQSIKGDYTLGEDIVTNPWHHDTIRGPVSKGFRLTVRNIHQTVPSLSATSPTFWEVYMRNSNLLSKMNWHCRGTVSFYVCLVADNDILIEWKEVKFPPTIRRIISRVSNRVFVGAPLCKVLDSVIPALIDVPQAGIQSGGTSMLTTQ